MSIQSLLFLALQASVFLTVLTIGMGTSPADLRYLSSKPARLFRSLLVMNVLAPFVTIVVCRTFSLHPALSVGLVALAISPVSNLFAHAMLPVVRTGRAAYAYGLFFASTVLSVILTPLAVEVLSVIYAADEHVNPFTVAQVVVGTVLLPLGIGLTIGRRWPSARQWIAAIQKVSALVLLVCAVVIIAAAWPLMGALYRVGTVTAIVLITLIALAVGHALGGPDEDDRTVLAHATVSRHPGVAMVVTSLTDQPLAPVGVLLAVLMSAIAVMPYTHWRKRVRADVSSLAVHSTVNAGRRS
jgi:BASS family bile acid:Na+ symporter